MKPAFLFFISLFLPFVVNASVVINEIAWMGDENDWRNEWIELAGSAGTDLSGWALFAESGSPEIEIHATIPASGFLVLSRGVDYTGFLNNTGEILVLRDANGNEVNRVDAFSGWPAGNNTTKETMQRSGDVWMTAPATKGARNADMASNTKTSDGNASSSPSQTKGTNASRQNSESSSIQGESSSQKQNFADNTKRLIADAGKDIAVIAGVAKRFEGQGFDFEGKPLENGDFLWTFGDGSYARGRLVLHTFYYPGTYRVVLNVSSGRISASDAINVLVVQNGVEISEVKPGKAGFIEIANNSDYEIDLSYWAISNGALAYYLPERTFILQRSRLTIPHSVSGIDFSPSGAASILYPNGAIASSLLYEGVLNTDESFHLINGEIRIGLVSPGEERFITRMRIAEDEMQKSHSALEQQKNIHSTGINASFSPRAGIEESEKNDATNELAEPPDQKIPGTITQTQLAGPLIATAPFNERWLFWVLVAFGVSAIGGVVIFMLRRAE